MNIATMVCSGRIGGEHPIGHIKLKPSDVAFASGHFGSTYILKMGLHYDRYVVSGLLPVFQATGHVYTAARIAATSTNKSRAASVTGNIGESIAAVVARRKLNATALGDVLPIVASSTAKTPDFLIRLRPMFPASFAAAVGKAHAVKFWRWPVESKAVEDNTKSTAAVKRALEQLGTYWYKRFPFDPDVCGYGIVVCLIYGNNQRRIRIHVFTPSSQKALQERIEAYRDDEDDRDGFIDELTTEGSELRGFLNDLDE